MLVRGHACHAEGWLGSDRGAPCDVGKQQQIPEEVTAYFLQQSGVHVTDSHVYVPAAFPPTISHLTQSIERIRRSHHVDMT